MIAKNQPSRITHHAMFLTTPLIILFIFMGVPAISHAWIDGTPYFFERGGFKPVSTVPPSAPAQPNAPQLAIGDRRSFFSIDFRTNQQYTVEATLRAIGKFCYVFVEDSQWGRTVNAGTVESVRRGFDDATPADARRGIYQIETDLFGPPPDIDRDVRIYLLLLDIRDGTTVGGGFVAGFFSPVNEQRGILRDPELGTLIRSNELDMLYIDTHPLDAGSPDGLSVIAHEFQHLIHWRYDPNEEVWVNEGCSDYTMFLCGYSVQSHLDAFERNPEVSLINWPGGTRSQLAYYGAAYLWMLYLHERYGGEGTIAAIVKNRGTGIAGINNALSSRGITKTSPTIFADWKIANYLDDTTFANGQYGYQNERLNLRSRREHRSYPIAVDGNVIDSYAANYIALSASGGDSGLNIAFETDGEYPYDVRAIELRGDDPIAVRNMPLTETGKGNLIISHFGTTRQEPRAPIVDKVILVPNVQPKNNAPGVITSSYAYSAKQGEKVKFRTAVLPNPVHPRYWDIIAVPGDPIGVNAPRITVTAGQGVIASQLPMQPVRDGAIYTYSLYLSPQVTPENVRWQITFLGELVGEGALRQGEGK